MSKERKADLLTHEMKIRSDSGSAGWFCVLHVVVEQLVITLFLAISRVSHGSRFNDELKLVNCSSSLEWEFLNFLKPNEKKNQKNLLISIKWKA